MICIHPKIAYRKGQFHDFKYCKNCFESLEENERTGTPDDFEPQALDIIQHLGWLQNRKVRIDYAGYLKGNEWKAKRLQVLIRDKYICQGCLKNKATEVHHLTYDHIGQELLHELISLCGPCHRKTHYL